MSMNYRPTRRQVQQKKRKIQPRFFIFIAAIVIALVIIIAIIVNAMSGPSSPSGSPTPTGSNAAATQTPTPTPDPTGSASPAPSDSASPDPSGDTSPTPSTDPSTSPSQEASNKPSPSPLPPSGSESTDKIEWWYYIDKNNGQYGFDKTGIGYCNQYGALYQMDTSKKAVYFTYDCGYENGNTGKILDALKKHNIKGVFFITKPFMTGNDALVRRMIDEGHVVGNHTVTHPDLSKVDEAKFIREVKDFGDEFESKYGKKMTLLRPPEGSYSQYVLAEAKRLGYTCVFWDFAYLDFDTDKQPGADYAFDKVKSQLHNGMLLLLHAVSSSNADAMDRIIVECKSQGYEMLLLPH